MDRAATGLGFVLAIVSGMLAMSQVNTLQDLSKPITTGAVNTAVGTTTFLMLLVVVVIGVGGIVGALLAVTRR